MATYVGSSGADNYFGNATNDLIIGNSGADTLRGGFGNDLIYGGSSTIGSIADVNDNDSIEGEPETILLMGALALIP